jgi:hypothetical protein
LETLERFLQNGQYAQTGEAAMKPMSQVMLAAAATFALAAATTDVRALPLSVSDSLTFATQDQSLWGPGTDPVAHKEFTAPIINVDTGSVTVGEIWENIQTIPNPLYLAWKVAYDGCRKLYSHNTCVNGATINLGFTKIKIRGLGNAPAATLNVPLGKNGLELTSDIDVEAGFKGSFTLDGGKVDVTYPTTAALQTERDSYAAGELVTLKTFETLSGTPTMTTEFSDIDTSLKAYADLDIKADVEAYVLGAGGKTNIVDVDTGLLEQELLGVSVGNSEIGLRLFGEDPIVLDTAGGLGANIPSSLFGIYYPNKESPVKIPLADLQLQVPNLDTNSPDDSTWTGGKITNTQLPIDRTAGSEDDLTLIGGGVGFHRTDFAKIDIDVDGIISAVSISAGTPIIFGLTGGVTGILSLEGNLIDFDMGAFLGFGQTLTFEPTLMAELNFSTPLQVESKTTPGLYEEMSSVVLAVGDEFDFIHPGVDFSIDPTYYLDNSFTNLTEFLISPVASLSILQLKLTGLVAEILGVGFDAAIFQQVFPLVDPIHAATIGSSDPFALEGFERFEGTALFLRTAQASIPEPSAPALILLGLFMLTAVTAWGTRRGEAGSVF